MASFTLNRSDLFPVGTTVGAYPFTAGRRFQDLAPSQPATESQVVAVNGQAAFVALAADTDYLFYAFVGGQHRMTRGRTKTPTGVGSVQGAQGRAVGVATTSSGSTGLTGVSASSGAFQVGQQVSGPGIPAGTYLTGGSGASWTMSDKATASGVGAAVEGHRAYSWRAQVMRRRVAVGTS
jgi:hypothetical protein